MSCKPNARPQNTSTLTKLTCKPPSQFSVISAILLLGQLASVSFGQSGQATQTQRVVFPGRVATRPNAGVTISARQLGEKCAARMSCAQRNASSENEPDPLAACHCDELCALYDDCCHDARFAGPADQLSGPERRARRAAWQCKQINPIFGAILLRASCRADWPSGERDVRHKCELAAAANFSSAPETLQSDPLGLMMPVTDQTSGVTYANAYCLRCNLKRLDGPPSRFVYWSPYVTCTYDLDSDDRNALYDLISAQRGRALRYSPTRNSWLIVDGAERAPSGERECQMVPTVPDSVERLVRFCEPNSIDSCPASQLQRASGSADKLRELQRTLAECLHGHQAIVYGGEMADRAYRNPACARCNAEPRPHCEPARRRSLAAAQLSLQFKKLYSGLIGRYLPGALDGSAATLGRGSSLNAEQQSSTGSFSLLMDLYGAFQAESSSGASGASGNAQVGAVHRCEDAERQVYDSFLATCRDIVCGLNHRFIDGTCVEDPKRATHSTEPSSLDARANLTAQVVVIESGNLTRNENGAQAVKHMEEREREDSPHRMPFVAGARSTTLASDQSHLLHQQLAIGVVNGTAATATQKHTEADDDAANDKGSSGAAQANVHRPRATLLSPPPGSRSISEALANSSTSFNSFNEDEPKKQVVQLSSNDRQASERLEHAPKEKLIDQASLADKSGATATAAAAAKALAVQNGKLEIGTPEEYLSMLPGGARQLPQPSEASRRHFAECGKILVEPEHYRLFTRKALVSLLGAKDEIAPSSSAPVDLVEQDAGADLVWALVPPYNLTLAPSQFELVRRVAAAAGSETNSSQFQLLVCSPFKDDLVSKFHPAMAYLTTCCLVISIASLVCYLVMHLVSTLDLRSLVVEMAQAASKSGERREQSRGCFWVSAPLDSKFRDSRASNEAAAESTRAQSLSSRGVACLSAALLAAYLLFIIGHQRQGQQSELASGGGGGGPLNAQQQQQQQQEMVGAASSECALVATGTYFFFLLAFSWMFLLSFDIWRTLRLATCCLRAPATHSQARRFLIYAVCAFAFAGSVALIALVLDQIDTNQLGCQAPATKCSGLALDLGRFVQNFKPKFGQRPGSCWFSNKRSLALFFGLPVTFIMVLNLLFFLHSSFMVIKTSSRSSRRPIKQSSSSSFQLTCSLQTKLGEQQASSMSYPASGSTSSASIGTNSVDFTQQNNLTTSSLASVQTIQSQLDLSSVVASRRSSTDSTSTNASFRRQDSLNESANSSGYTSSASSSCAPNKAADFSAKIQVKGEEAERWPIGEHVPRDSNCVEHSKQKSSLGISECSLSSASKFNAAKANILSKCDLQLNQLGALVNSLIKDYRLYCRLSTIMGLTWLIGLIASIVDQSEVLWYMFVVLNTLQGLFIFIAFGLKRSKLTNLSIILCYLAFRIQLLTKAPNGFKQRTDSTNS